MPLLEEEYRKEEKINGVIYDMSPSPNYQHGLVDGNIYRIISTGLQGTLCLAFMENNFPGKRRCASKKILWKNTTFSDCQGSCQQKYIFFVLSDYQIVCCP